MKDIRAIDCKPTGLGWIEPDHPHWNEWSAWNERILVLTVEGPLIVNVPEDGLPMYEWLDEIAEPDEWLAWSRIPGLRKSLLDEINRFSQAKHPTS